MKRLKILLYVEQMSMISPRSIERLSSLISILMGDEKVEMSILPKFSVSQETQASLSTNKRIRWLSSVDASLDVKGETEGPSMVDINNKIKELESENSYHIIILHCQEIMKIVLHTEYGQKVIPYLTEIDYLNDEAANALEKLPAVFVENEKMKEALLQIVKLSEDKIIIVPPLVGDTPSKPEFRQQYFSMLSYGKLTDEAVNLFQAVKREQILFSMTIISDRPEQERKGLRLFNRYRKFEGLTVFEKRSERDVNRLIGKSDLGFFFHTPPTINHDPIDILEEFLAFAIRGKPIILNRTALFETILGKDYPLFADSIQEAQEKIVSALVNQKMYLLAAERCFNGSLRFQCSEVSKYILGKLWGFNPTKETILFAGHDFKFLKEYIAFCQSNQLNVLIDKWSHHNVHDSEKSQQLLQEADIIFCEWGLGNALFYSNNKLQGQRLYIRVHRQELETEYLDHVNYENVTKVIAVSPYILEEFNRLKHIPREKLILIPNMVDVNKYQKTKKENIKYNIGIMGVLPRLKRIDRAVQIFEKLWQKNKRYKLFIKGKLPEDLPWLKNRKAEMDYFTEVFDKIKNAPWKDHIIFDKHGDDVEEWLTNINFMLSTSDIEGFHLAPMEGMASGATPIVFTWPGSSTIYPNEFIVDDVEEAVDLIIKLSNEDKQKEKDYLPIVSKYDKPVIFDRLNQLLFK